MKRRIFGMRMLAILLAFGLVLAGCDNPSGGDNTGGDNTGGGSGTTTYTVTFNASGGGSISASPTRGIAGTTVTLSNTADSGYIFAHEEFLDPIGISDKVYVGMVAFDEEVRVSSISNSLLKRFAVVQCARWTPGARRTHRHTRKPHLIL